MLNTHTIPVSDLVLDPRNARVHPEENLAAIQASLERFGQVLPLVVRDNVVLGGNGTLTAMRRLGFTHADIIRFEGSEEEGRALAIALNRTAEKAQWDPAVLGQTLLELAEGGVQPEALGFSAADLDALLPAEPVELETFRPHVADPDATPAPREPAAGESSVLVPVAQYALIFDDEAQQKRFFSFLRRLKQAYPDVETVAGRLDRFSEETKSLTSRAK